jgi:type IV secretory pathway TraG/TraD family ATPase VirD4
MIQEFLNFLKDYNLVKQISLSLSAINLILFFICIITPVFIYVALKSVKFVFKFGNIIGIIAVFFAVYSINIVQDLFEQIIVTVQNENLVKFIVKKYYLAIPISIIIIIALGYAGYRTWLFLLKDIFTNAFANFGLKRWIKNVEKHHEVLVFNSKPKTVITNIFRGVLIHGGAGSGKSKTFIYPILSQMIQKRFCGIVYDFKAPELIEFVKSIHTEENPLKLIEVSFKNPGSSHQINLLNGVQNISEVKELSSTLWKNLNNESIKKRDYWNTSAENLLTATMYVLIKHHPRYATVPHALAIILNFTPEELIEFIAINRQASGLIKSITSANELGASKQVSGTLGTLQNFISNLATPEIFWLLSGSVMPTPNDIENPSILLLGNESTMYETYSPVIAMIITATIRKMNQPNMLKSMVVLDELPTLFIPSLETLPATSRSNKIATIVGVQDMSQLIDKYGKEKSDIILSNLGSQFFGRSTLEKTAKYVSDIFGKFDKLMTSQTSGSSSNSKDSTSSSGTTQSYQERSRLKPQEILNLNAGQFCGFIAEGHPKEFIKKQFGEFKKPIEKPKKEILFNEIKSVKKEVPYAIMEQRFEEIYYQIEQLKSN